jgi:uncharacterized protein (TIGR02145 family)
MKKTILFIILLLLLVAACVYYNCMQKDKFELEKKLAVTEAVQKAIDSINHHQALEPPMQVVVAHQPPPVVPAPKKEKIKKPVEKPTEEPADPNVFTDERDGQQYHIFEADGMTWMGQNLNFATAGSWCYNLEDQSCEDWGRLYTWNDAMIACPAGWHLPDDHEWMKLINYYGGIHYAGQNLKAGGPSDFNAVMSGYRDKAGFFGKVNESAYFWSSTTQSPEYASFKGIYHNVDNVGTYTYTKPDGMSVRCIKD